MTSRGAANDARKADAREAVEYQNFRVEISASGQGDGHYQARVVDSPAAEGRTLFFRPLDEAALEALTSAFDAARQRNFTPDGDDGGDGAAGRPGEALRRLGEELFENLFSSELASLWNRSLGPGERPSAPLRLLLQMQLDDAATARLHALPWECLRPPGDGLPLLLDPDFSLVRYLSQPGTPELPERPSRLKVLAVSADVACGELAALDVDRELEALESTGVDLKVEDDLPFERLDGALREHRPHVLHFLGHGGFRDGAGGALYFRDATGAPQPLDPEAVARCLKPCDSLRLIFLNACVTARASHRAPFAGVATGLIRKAGVPAVIAMQRPVSDAGAAAFAAAVYEHLAAGATLDRAVSEGRRRLTGTEWATPVLFSRLPDGRLFAGGKELETASLRRRWSGWAAALALVVSLMVAGVGVVPRTQDASRSPQRPDPVAETGDGDMEYGPSEADSPGTGEAAGRRRERAEGDTGDRQTLDEELPRTQLRRPVTLPSETAQPPRYHLEDGGSVYVPELGSYLSAEFNDVGEFAFPTLNLSGSDAPRAVESPRRVDFPVGDGETVSVDVVSIDDRARSLTVTPASVEPAETAG